MFQDLVFTYVHWMLTHLLIYQSYITLHTYINVYFTQPAAIDTLQGQRWTP